MQEVCVAWARLQHPAAAMLLHHSPNGGRRDAREGARFKAMGTSAGFPDLFLCLARGPWHGLAIEMKSDEGRLTATQRGWGLRLDAEGYRYEVCRSFDQFRAIVDGYLALGDYKPNDTRQ